MSFYDREKVVGRKMKMKELNCLDTKNTKFSILPFQNTPNGLVMFPSVRVGYFPVIAKWRASVT